MNIKSAFLADTTTTSLLLGSTNRCLKIRKLKKDQTTNFVWSLNRLDIGV